MKFSRYIEKAFRKFIPAPFTLAILLTLFTLLIAFFFTGNQSLASVRGILTSWQTGMWEPGLLVFAVQMMLILVLGHILVLSKPVSWLTERLTNLVSGNGSAVLMVTISTMLVAFFNWGLGLIFGAIMARKVGEAAQKRNFKINYPLIGAAGYSGLMIWHGGISGSAPLKVAESGHLKSLFSGSAENDISGQLPDLIPTSLSIFSSWNLFLFATLLVLVPVILWWIGKNGPKETVDFPVRTSEDRKLKISGAEKLDHSKYLRIGFGILLLLAWGISYYSEITSGNLTPNMLNFFMLGLCILLHRSFFSFLSALDEAIVGAGAILIQFPLYFGIMGVMKDTGIINEIAGFFTAISTETTLPVFTFFSGALVNIFVPSGGGQWAIQGPIVIESAVNLGIPLNKAVMAFAYGDQITNMLQPFWALPLLAITGLKAREILPYTIIMMLVGSLVYVTGLLII
ncbi:short-chain fatty acid transporter [Gramella sp. BOM4]|nr:short-chain fatty acid transporter [Christiangramia bathymodioli]